MIDYKDALDEMGKSIAIDCFNAAHKSGNILYVDFSVTSRQLEILQNYLPGRIFVNSGKNIENTHPVHAYLTRYCYEDIRKELIDFENVVEIGTSFTRHTNVQHNCVLISDARTLTRYTQQAVNLTRSNMPLANELLNACCGDNSSLCTKGTQYCNYQADVGFAVHATYDINLPDIARMMINHQFKLFYAYMYLPTSLIDDSVRELINNKFGFEYSRIANTAYFALGDRSFIYEHNYKVWRSYLTTTKIDVFDKNKHGQYTITMEIDREWGPLNRIKFVMTKYAPGNLTRRLPHYPFLEKIVIIPNIFKYIYKDQVDLPSKLNEYLHLPMELANKCLNYISRMPDENYKYSNFEAYFNGQMTEVKFDGNTVWHGWHPDSPEELRHTVVSLFCIGASNRNDRTKVISGLMKKLQTSEWGHYCQHEELTRSQRLKIYIRNKWPKINKYCCFIPYDRSHNVFINGPARFDHEIFANLHPQKFKSWTTSHSVSIKMNCTDYKKFKLKQHIPDNRVTDIDISSLFTSDADEHDVDKALADDAEEIIEGDMINDYSFNPFCSYGDIYSYKIDDKPLSPVVIKVEDDKDIPIINYGKLFKYKRLSDSLHIARDVINDLLDVYPNVNIKRTNSRCPVLYSPVGDGYCGRSVLAHYGIKTNLPPWITYTTLINEALKHSQVLIHIHDNNENYTCFIPNDKTTTIILGFDIISAHYYVPQCLCGGGLRATVSHDNNNYNVDQKYWYKHRNLYTNTRDNDRVVKKILECLPVEVKSIFEMSYAPGHFAKYCEENNYEYYCGHYVGEDALAPVYQPKHVTQYVKIKELPNTDKFILSDIGDEKTLALVVDDLIQFIGINDCLIKAFTNDPVTINKISAHLGNYTIFKPSFSFCTNSEVYLLKYGKIDVKNKSSEIFDRITNHIHSRNNVYHYDTIDCKQRNIDNYCKQLTDSKLHTTIKSAIINTPSIIPIEYTNGVAGCGKTRGIELARYDAYVCPLKKLVKRIPHHYTYEVFLVKVLEGKKFNAVYVDEAYLIPKGWYGAVYNTGNVKSFILLGDPYQIMLVDFNDCYDTDDVVFFGNSWDNNTSLRFGKNTANLLNGLIKELPKLDAIRTDDKVSVEYLKDNLYDLSQGYKVLHFRQEDKKLFENSSTIHEAQGSTFPKVLLYVDGAELDRHYIRDYRYTYVGMTRHIDELRIVIKSVNSAHTFFSMLDSIIHVNISEGVEPIPDVIHIKNVTRLEQPLTEEVTDTHINDLGAIEDVLSQCGFTPNDSNVVTYMSSNLIFPERINSWGDKSKAHLRIRNLDTKETMIHGFRPSRNNYVRHYAPQNSVQTLHTIITRYMRVAQRRSYKKFTPYFNMCDKLHKGLLKFTPFKTSDEYYEYMAPTFNDLQAHMHDYLLSLQEKINSKVYNELNQLNEDIKLSIDFFMKKQPKFMSKPITINTKINKALLREFTAEGIFGLAVEAVDNITTQQKAGQGVSAWPKRFNLIFAAYTRHMMHKFIEMPSKKGTRLIIGVGKSDKEIGAAIGEAISQGLDVFAFKGDDTLIYWKKSYKCTDFSEHDTSHSLVVRMCDCFDMIKMGFDAKIIARFWNAYLHWRQNVNGDTQITVENYLMQHSGSPNTIYGNTKLTASANGACFELKPDGTIHQNKISDVLKADCSGFLKLNDDLTDVFGFRLKQDDSNPAEFICNIITPYGMFPDVVRRTARYISKIYVDQDDFEKTRTNIRDCVSTVLNEEAKNYGIYAATKYYNNHGMHISSNQVAMLYNFLKSDTLTYHNDKQLYYIETLQPLNI